MTGATNRVAVILVDAGAGRRTILWSRDPALRMEGIDDAGRAAVLSGRILLVDGEDVSASTMAARSARAAAIPTLVDIDDVQPGADALLHQIDAIITAEAFPAALTGHPDLGRALETIDREYRPPLVCVTLGEGGSLARCGGREIRTRPFAVNCVDTTGAGDVFRAGFAAACLRGSDGDIEAVLAYANAAAALSCRALGARGALPTTEEIDRMMKEQSW
jgi:sugar/nucleoside kinase (ribokinase family)